MNWSLSSSLASFQYLHSGSVSLNSDMYASHVCEAFCFIFLNLKWANVWLDSGLNTFSKASNTSLLLSIWASTEFRICVASLPSQFTNKHGLCFSLRSDNGSSNEILQLALNCFNSVNLSWLSQSNMGLENCRPPNFEIWNNLNEVTTTKSKLKTC